MMVAERRCRERAQAAVDPAGAGLDDGRVAELYERRIDQIRDAVSDLRDPDTVAWFITTLALGIGMKESIGLPLPDGDRLHDVFMTAFAGLSGNDA